MMRKIRPNANIKWSEGNDGRDGHYYIEYTCAGCGRIIRGFDTACDRCGTFHDWSQKAEIVVKREVAWR